MTPERTDIAVIGAGAAGLFAAVFAGRAVAEGGGTGRVLAVDGARSLGAKILVAGGGRCNVTHHAVDETAYAGSSRNAIRRVLSRFGVDRTVAFFDELGVRLKREETGKLFPTTDRARTVLDALLRAVGESGARVRHPWRVDRVERAEGEGFLVHPVPGSEPGTPLLARRVVLATGGRALPRTGSDGHGYSIARALGHTVTPRVFPALVPLTLDPTRSFIPSLSGLTVPATLTLSSGTGKKLASFTDSTLCTHFGLSGPSVLDISRYYLDAVRDDPGATLSIGWAPGRGFEWADAMLGAPERVSVARTLAAVVPERLARALCESVRVDPATPTSQLRRDDRRALARALTATPLPVTGDRGFAHAEVTAGGVPLSEVHLETMESRVCPGLHLCGEICDVDGRIGGFNFQWAWASGFVAGSAAGALTAR